MLKVHDTLKDKPIAFKPIKRGRINLFVCGITPYDYAHIGHAKSYVQFDVIARYLRYLNFKVFYLQNVTNIDDKTIARAKEENKAPLALAEFYFKTYLEDMKALNIKSVTKYAKATNYIKQIISQIQRLKKAGFAYQIPDGIYFDISKFKKYGKLSKQKLEELKQHRIEPNPDKRNPGDFALWKKAKPSEPSWPSPFGNGRPGWHIEDTAITEHFFGSNYDIHGGGSDLIFPHHEAEIAQMESLSKKPLANYWLHNGFLLINNEKMSKSLNNFITIKDAVKKYGSMPLRFLFATSHYRAQMNFTEQSIEAASSGYETLKNTLIAVKTKLSSAKPGKLDKNFIKKLESHKAEFIEHMNSDFNTPKAAASLFNISHDLNAYNCTKQTLSVGLKLFLELTGIFGLILEEKLTIPKQIHDLVKQREQARKNKNFALADQLRNQIKQLGFWVDDTESGPVIRKIS